MGRAKTVAPDLPARMIRRIQRNGATFYYYVTQGSHRKEIPLGPDRLIALAEYSKLTEKEEFRRPIPAPAKFEKALLQLVKKNARARGIPVHITETDVQAMLTRAAGGCELTGVRFDTRVTPGYRVRPWVPSVDRIDSSKPYTKDNCRIVCAAVNLALNQFGEAVLLKIAAGVMRKRRSVSRKTLRSAPRGNSIDELAEEIKPL